MIKSALRERAIGTGRALRACAIAAGITLCVTPVYAQSDSQADDGVEDLYITIEAGDTFTGIVSRELIGLDAWGDVARFNKLESPDLLSPGDVIVIPAEILRRRNYAKVVFVKGGAIHHSIARDAKEEVVRGAKIYPGDLIETDENGFVSMSFVGGSSVKVQPESKMRINVIKCIDKDDACEIKLNSENGRLSLDVQSVGFEKPTKFSIDTPYASAAVRGTRFDFDIDKGNILGVTDGVVEISLNGVSNNIDIGKGVLAGEGRSINDTYDLLVQPPFRLSDDINRVSTEDVISWDVVSGASKYLVAYAGSETMQDVVVSLTEPDNITKPDLSDGDYYVSARAVDPNGLRGFTAKKKISRVKIDPASVAPELEVLIRESDMQVTATGGTGAVEIKVGNSLETIDTIEYLVATGTHQLNVGQTITVPVDLSKQWYLQGRRVVNKNTVSPYGLLYFFDKKGQ